MSQVCFRLCSMCVQLKVCIRLYLIWWVNKLNPIDTDHARQAKNGLEKMAGKAHSKSTSFSMRYNHIYNLKDLPKQKRKYMLTWNTSALLYVWLKKCMKGFHVVLMSYKTDIWICIVFKLHAVWQHFCLMSFVIINLVLQILYVLT